MEAGKFTGEKTIPPTENLPKMPCLQYDKRKKRETLDPITGKDRMMPLLRLSLQPGLKDH